MGGEVADLYQPESMGDAFFVVEVQERGRRPPARGTCLDQGTIETKVALPALRSRMEERHDSARVRVNGCKIRVFKPVAGEAGQGEVVQ